MPLQFGRTHLTNPFIASECRNHSTVLISLPYLLGVRRQGAESIAMADKPTPDELKRRYEEIRGKAVASFPFVGIEATADQALANWGSLGASGCGAPVVIGDDDALYYPTIEHSSFGDTL